MENFAKLLEEESESMNHSLQKIEEELEKLYHRRYSSDEETHLALRILEEISNTETALDGMLDQVERENTYLTKKTEDTRADLKVMENLVNNIERKLGVQDGSNLSNMELNSLDCPTELNSEDYLLNSIKIERDDFSDEEQDESMNLNKSLEKLEEEVQQMYERENNQISTSNM